MTATQDVARCAHGLGNTRPTRSMYAALPADSPANDPDWMKAQLAAGQGPADIARAIGDIVGATGASGCFFVNRIHGHQPRTEWPPLQSSEGLSVRGLLYLEVVTCEILD